MKTKPISLLIILVSLLCSCEKSEDIVNIDSIQGIKWTLSKIIDNETGEIERFPEQLDKFDITFTSDGNLELLGFCNFSYGDYELISPDSLRINRFGPSTLMYCLPDLRMDWELIFATNTNFPNSETYTITDNELTINCNSEYDLVFNYVENTNTKQGKVLFCTNSAIINCPFEIEISIDDKDLDTLTVGSTYNTKYCECEGTLNIGSAVDLNVGEHVYNANDINCISDNKVNSWSGNITVFEDSCTMIFLDITKK
ncbi:MAG: META domain-containing protein [Chlorobi bacterium]|nr:META domain-containing protein [Chlorobiota bacterium]